MFIVGSPRKLRATQRAPNLGPSIAMAATTTELLGRIADINNTTVMFLWHATASCSADRHAAQTRLVEGLRLLTSLCNETGLYADLGEVGSGDSDSFTVTILPLALDEQQSESSQEIFQALFLMSRPESPSQANAVAAVLLYNLALMYHCSGEQSGTSRRVGVALKLNLGGWMLAHKRP